MNRITSTICRTLFVIAFVLVGIGLLEKLSNVAGYTFLRDAYTPGRLLDLSVVVLLFVIALLLREIQHGMAPRSGA